MVERQLLSNLCVREILFIVTDGLDLNDVADGLTIDAIEGARAHWQAAHNFRVRKTDECRIVTTIGPDDDYLIHSIDDQPALIILATGDEDHDDHDDDEKPCVAVVHTREWACFGLLHRDNGFARQSLQTGTQIGDIRLWATHGVPGRVDGGPTVCCVSRCYSGLLWDWQFWYSLPPAPTALLLAGRLLFDEGIRPPGAHLHRTTGPAWIQVCREPTNGGPFPRALYYLGDVNVTRELFAQRANLSLAGLVGPTGLWT